jgi:hypothetical protein
VARAGQILEGKYQIVREIGRGAMGVVYEALHITLGRRVAVKTLLSDTGGEPELAARFEREARAASAIGHPHIVDVFDLGRTPEGLLFMAMELLDGHSLAALLGKTRCLPIPLAIHLTGQILSGLGAAHRNGIVHRDLKPENIFILNTEDRPNFVKIVDFGISKMLVHAAPGQGGVVRASGGTVVGTIMGTPLYMSPEQILGQVALIDHRTDIYSAGVVFYEMLCGRSPFEDESQAQVFVNILDGRYFMPRGLRPEIPPSVEAAIVCALDRDREKRFASAAAMREAITGRSADLTPPPELVSASFGGRLPAVRRHEDVDVSSAIVLQEEAGPPQKFGGGDELGGSAGTDRFAPEPDNEAVPLLAAEVGRTPAARTLAAEAAIEPDDRLRARPGSASRGVMAPDNLLSARNRSRIVKALGLLALLILARLAYSYLRSTHGQAGQDAPVRKTEPCKVTLAVDPTEASVQVDHIPVTREDLLLDEGTPHVIQLAAPGRITRRLSFEAKPGLELSLRLGRVLPLPSPTDPDPSRAELATSYPEDPFVLEEINRAFAKLDRYARCLAIVGDSDGDDRKGKSSRGPRAGEIGRCIQLLDEASALAPNMSELHAAGGAYLQGASSGQGAGALHKLLATFRSEFLAVRAAWQMEELSREETDGGQTAAWHMRRVALTAQAWLRQSGASLSQVRGLEDRRAKLEECHRAFLNYAKRSPREMAQVSGVEAFMHAAQFVVALARNPVRKGRNDSASVAACRQLLAAFNALVVE